MAHWNYRVVREIEPDGEPTLFVTEVYYDDEGKPDGYTERGALFLGETPEEIRASLTLALYATNEPILDATDMLDSSLVR